ncbi:MAG: sigma-70 family RNA polymerase sigma factor [Deltaproteobacteria bacterium]|nr:sigma-70 family RNA polymerase sigma factor [Deltaproteobacteria bacterium]
MSIARLTFHRATPRPPRDDGSAAVQAHGALLQRCVRVAVARTRMWHLRDDFWVAGAMALLDARGRWEPARGVPFAVFAERRIRGAIVDELRRHDHLPRRLRLRANTVRHGRDGLRMTLGREPTGDEVSAHVGMAPDLLSRIDAVATPPAPLDELPAVAQDGDTAMEHLQRRQDREAVAMAVSTLPDRLRGLVRMRYVEGLSSSEIARRMGVSEPRVSQLHASAIKRLRSAMGGQRRL